MSEELSKNGLYFDELYTLRVIEPDIANETSDLEDDCHLYTKKLEEFYEIAERFVTIAEQYAAEVNKEKMETITLENLLKTIVNQRESEQQQIQAQILEKSTQLDRIKVEYQYLQRLETEQQEIINNYYLNQ